MKYKILPQYYFGHLQGYKVYINDKKYPLQRGFFYTTMNESRALIHAKNDFNRLNNNK